MASQLEACRQALFGFFSGHLPIQLANGTFEALSVSTLSAQRTVHGCTKYPVVHCKPGTLESSSLDALLHHKTLLMLWLLSPSQIPLQHGLDLLQLVGWGPLSSLQGGKPLADECSTTLAGVKQQHVHMSGTYASHDSIFYPWPATDLRCYSQSRGNCLPLCRV